MIDVNLLMQWEDGELDRQETIDLFQKLVDSGEAWQLQGIYGRMAQRLLDAGEIHHPYNFRVDDVMLPEGDRRESGFMDLTRHGDQ